MSFVKLREESKGNETAAATQSALHSVTGGLTPSNSGLSKADAFLGKGTKIVGTLHFSGSAEIDCEVEGEIHARESLVISESAIVKGKIVGAEVLVRGTVHGDIIASKKLTLKRPAKVLGNIIAANLSIEEGVTFEGKCSMNNAADASRQLGSKPAGADKAGVAA